MDGWSEFTSRLGRKGELVVDGLDEFKRKEAYRDGLLIALLELGVTS